jgi:hypothetical protein
VRNTIYKRLSRLCALLAVAGIGASGCFPADEPVETASRTLPLKDLNVSPSAVSHWLAWFSPERKLTNFDLGPVGADFYLGIHVDNATELLPESVTYDEANNTISAVVYVNACNNCDFRVTMFIVETPVGAAAPVRVVRTYSGTSPIVVVAPSATADVTMDIQLLPTGEILFQPTSAVADGYEVRVIDKNENVSFPSVTRASGSADPSVVVANIPIARPMILQVRRTATDQFADLTCKNGTPPSIDSPNQTRTCEFDMP